MQLLKVRGQKRIAIKKTTNLSSILVTALKSNNQFIGKCNSKNIQFSAFTFWDVFYRFDCFYGISNGEIEIRPEKEGKANIVFTLDTSIINLLLLFVTLGTMFTWPQNVGLLSALLREKLVILLIGIAVFFIWSEYVRFAMKIFISRALKDLYLKHD